MRFVIKARVPDVEDITAGLTLEHDPGLTAARRALEAATGTCEDVRRRYTGAVDALVRTKRDVLDGREPAAALEAAQRARDVEAIAIGRAERKVEEATAQVAGAEAQARDAIIAEAARRRDALQAIADEVRPLLEQLRECEQALDMATHAVRPWATVPALEWPQSLVDQAGAASARQPAVVATSR